MKILYMPGLASLTDENFDINSSCKYPLIKELADCHIFDYRKYHASDIVKYLANFDALFGSSFGGYYCFYLGILTGKPTIVVNPSLYLDERINNLIKEHPKYLSFINPSELNSIKKEPTGKLSENVHVLMNTDDEILDVHRILSIAEAHLCNIYTFEKGGHKSVNFQGEMLPTVKMIFNNIQN